MISPLVEEEIIGLEATIIAHVIEVDEFGAFELVALCGKRVMGVPAPAGTPLCLVCDDLAGGDVAVMR